MDGCTPEYVDQRVTGEAIRGNVLSTPTIWPAEEKGFMSKAGAGAGAELRDASVADILRLVADELERNEGLRITKTVELFRDLSPRNRSNNVHLTPAQIQERIAAVDAGRTPGSETPANIEELNAVISRSLAASLVLIYHCVPDHVAGDWFVEDDGATVAWYFRGSRFLAAVDAYFDYKAERQDRLADPAKWAHPSDATNGRYRVW